MFDIKHLLKTLTNNVKYFTTYSWLVKRHKTDRHDITEILLKVVLNTITSNPNINNS